MREIPNSGQIVFKPAYEERYRGLLGKDYQAFKKCNLCFLRRSIRVNTLKIAVKELVARMNGLGWKTTPVPWCREGFWVEHETGRRDIGRTLEYSLGYYYVQEAASMIPPLVLEPQEGERILDMCAAPGSKATQIAQLMNNTGLVFANDINGARMSPLGINIQRMGATNCVLTMMEGQRFARAGMQYDRILLDAPCSGTGTIRKSLGTLLRWNPQIIRKLARVQHQLIDVAFRILKPGGRLVYSTCSTEPEENEAVVDSLLKKYPEARLAAIRLKLKSSPPILAFEGESYNKQVKKCLRLWPQDNDTEGFFVASIHKAPDMQGSSRPASHSR